jgi:hypothetical protein
LLIIKSKTANLLNTILVIAIATLTFSCDESESVFDPISNDGIELSDRSGNNFRDFSSGQLTAGEWNDLENWDFWFGLQQNRLFDEARQIWQIAPYIRYQINVLNPDNSPAVDARVTIQDTLGNTWSAKTNYQGRAELFLSVFQANVQFSLPFVNQLFVNGAKIESINFVPRFENGTTTVVLDSNETPENTVDIVMVVDATESMADEIEYIQAELLDVIDRSLDSNPGTTFRLGTVFYRDTDEEYLYNLTDLTTNYQNVVASIQAQDAKGGGDYPEAVADALLAAANNLTWSESAKTRMLFLVLDASPKSIPQELEKLKKAIRLLSEKGVQIVTVMASGADVSTEFITRSISVLSNGTYVFLTDDSGIGEPKNVPTVGDFQVELLNDLLVRLIGEQI